MLHSLTLFLQAPAPSGFEVILAALLKVVAPAIAGLIAVEYAKGVAFVQKFGAVAVAIAGVLFGALAAFVASKLPGVQLPADFAGVTADTITGILTALIALFTHTQSVQAAARKRRGLEF